MDIDIDFKNPSEVINLFSVVKASMVQKGELIKHPVGVYFQDIPKDNLTGLSAIPYKQAEELGYMKIDFLHLNLLEIFESKAEIRGLLKKAPDWKLLEEQEIVSKLSQIHKHFDLVLKVKPQSIEELADILALIRPGKRYLLDAYISDKKTIRTELYKKPEDSKKYYFKRSHAISYSLNIILQLHLMKEGII